MMEAKTPEQVAVWPWWLRGLVLALILAAFSQVTLRHWALWMSGARTGIAASIAAPDDAEGAILHDPMAVFKTDELAGDRLWMGDAVFPVIGNTATAIHLDAPAEAVRDQFDADRTSYVTGVRERGALVRLALKVPGIGFGLADVLLGLACVAMLIWCLWRRQWPSRQPPPWSIWIFLAIGVLSLFGWAHLFAKGGMAPDKGAGLRELAQLVEALLIAFLLFREVLREPAMRRQAMGVLTIGAGLLIAGALWEYGRILGSHTLRGLADIGELDSILGFRFNPGRSGAAGSESSKNMLAAYLVVLVPLLLAMSRIPARLGWRIALIVLAALGFVCILHPLLLLCTLAGAVLVALSWGRRWAVGAVLAGALGVQIVAAMITPHHGKILMDSAALWRYADPYGLLPMPMKGKNADDISNWMYYQQKYVEKQAALNALSMSPLLGHGLGNYQERINQYYTQSRLLTLSVAKEPANFMEQDAHGLYTVLAVETGIVGVLAMIGLLVSFLTMAQQASREVPLACDRSVLVGIAGSLLALLLAGVFISWQVRALQFIVVLLLAYTAAVRLPPVAPREPAVPPPAA